MQQADIRNCITDSGYVKLSKKEAREYGLSPHTVWINRRARRAVIGLQKSKVGPDYSYNYQSNISALKLLNHRDEMFKEIYLGQIDPDNPDRFLAWETLKNVQRLLNGHPPRQGQYGDYYYLQTLSFKPSGGPEEGEAEYGLIDSMRRSRRSDNDDDDGLF